MNEQNELRELDAQIAERLFGWRWTTRVYVGRTAPQQVHQPSNQFMPPESQVSHGDWKILPYDPTVPRGIQWQPAYSTDGNAMLAVLEKMREKGYTSSVGRGAGPIIAKFALDLKDAPKWTFADWIMAKGESIPEAVCRAALLALEATPEMPASHPFKQAT